MSKNKLLMIIGSIVLVSTITITVIFVNNSKNIKNFEITFDTNGGTIIEKQIVKKGEKITKPEDPVKNGYIFVEWVHENTTYDFNNVVTEDLILVAKYQEINEDIETFVVKFDSDGGTTISNQIIEKGNIIEKPEDPVKEGYTFIGWYLNDNIYDFSTNIENDIELKARWEEIKQTNNKYNEETNNKPNNNSNVDKNNSSSNSSNGSDNNSMAILSTPILKIRGGGMDPTVTAETYEVTEIEYADGIEIHKSTNGKDYVLEKIITKQDLDVIKLTAKSEHNYYKVCAYKTVNGSKQYSEYTKVYEIIND